MMTDSQSHDCNRANPTANGIAAPIGLDKSERQATAVRGAFAVGAMTTQHQFIALTLLAEALSHAVSRGRKARASGQLNSP